MFLISHGNITITPHMPVPLAGFPDRQGSYYAIDGQLEINLIAIKEDNSILLLYSIDTFLIPADFAKDIIATFGSNYNIGEQNVWLCATHTHFAPSLDEEKPLLGLYSEEYNTYVKKQLIGLTNKVLQGRFEEASISYLSGEAALNVNRRKKLLRFEKGKLTLKTLMYSNYTGNKETGLHILRVTGKGNRVLAYIWNYACHPVHAFRRNNVSADYVGIIRNKLRTVHAPDTTVVFLQGFAGNLKADITAVTHNRIADSLRYFFQLPPKYTQFPTEAYYNKWVNMLWEKFLVINSAKNGLEVNSGLGTSISKIPLAQVIGNSEDKFIVIKRIDLGTDISLIGINAEVVCEYAPIMKTLIPGRSVIPVAYTEGTNIYLPTDEMLKEKGYEVEGFKPLFNIQGDFKPSLKEKIVNAIKALKSYNGR